jgi:hypothetical protein
VSWTASAVSTTTWTVPPPRRSGSSSPTPPPRMALAGRQAGHGPGRARPRGTGAAALPTSPATTITRRQVGPAHPHLCHTHRSRCRCPTPAPSPHQHERPDRTTSRNLPTGTGARHVDGWRDSVVRSVGSVRVLALVGAAGQPQSDGRSGSRVGPWPRGLLLRELVQEHVASATGGPGDRGAASMRVCGWEAVAACLAGATPSGRGPFHCWRTGETAKQPNQRAGGGRWT